jgi:hypothetical protein
LRLALSILAVLAWAGAVIVSGERIWAYQSAPGASGGAPPQWPGSTLVNLSADRPTLIMFVHPRCSCTAASLAELREIATRFANEVHLWVLLNTPSDSAAADWEDTSLVKRAREIHNVTAVSDLDGMEAKRFGAETSGHVVIYDPAGNLRFGGGITRARGHAGDNDGVRTVVALLKGQTTQRTTHPTFGCGLLDGERRLP